MPRDHQPVALETFNGWWNRNEEAAPPDHFTDAENIQFFHSGFRTRDGLNTYLGIGRVLRLYTYTMQEGESLLILVEGGIIYHAIPGDPDTNTDDIIYGPILTIPTMTDFAYVAYAGRAYISPHNGETGLENEFLYLYEGDGIAARKAGGAAPISAPVVAIGAAGHVEPGVHIIGVVYETNSGFLTAISPLVAITVADPGEITLNITNVPVSPSSTVVARHIVASQAIDPELYTGNLEGYQLFFVPDGKIDNNTATSINVSFYDAELLDDAWHLLDLFEDIPAGVGLNTYHGRLVSWGEFGEDKSLIRVSYNGEPEAHDQVDGMVILPLDGKPVTYCQEFRDVLYGFKETRTYAINDNGDSPSSWPVTVIDQGIGCSVHGMATVLDSGGVNIDYLIVVDFSGVMLFNGSYLRPELSWKIRDYWLAISRTFFLDMQIYNDSLNQVLYITLPDKRMLIGDYSELLDPKEIKWAKWRFDIETTSITLIETSKLIIGT